MADDEKTERSEDDIEIDTGEDDEPSDEEVEFEDDDPNLVPGFLDTQEGRDFLKELSQRIKRRFDDTWESTEEYRDRRAKNGLIFAGKLPPKDFPFKDCANVHVPIMLETITRLHFRAMSELFGSWDSVFGVLPIGPDDEEIAELLSKHGNWQINEEIPNFKREQERALLQHFTDGDFTIHSLRDPFRNVNLHETLTADDFVVPYTHTSTMPDYSDCPYYFRVRHYYRHELEAMREAWHGVDDVIDREPPPWDSDPEPQLLNAAAQAAGIEVPDGDDSSPYKVLQYEGWEELPGRDRQYFVQAYLDYATGNFLALSVLEEPDWQELREYEQRLEARDQYLNMVDQHAADVAAYEVMVNALASAPPMPQVDPMTGMPMGPPPIPPPPMAPQMPPWMDPLDPQAEPTPPTMRPIHMFTHGVCIEPLAGNLGMGFGNIQADFNRAANTALNQFTDAATLANSRGLITSNLVKFRDGFSYRPGMLNVVDGVSGEELKRNIMPLEFGPASPQLMEVVNKMYEWGQSSVQAPEVLSGEAGKSGETFRGISARIEQATKQLSVSTRKYAEGPLKRVLQCNARLNAIFMPESQFVAINNHKLGSVETISVGRDLYRRDYKVAIKADLKFTGDAQRIADAEQMLSMLMSNPMLQQNVGIMQRALRKVFEARDQHDMVAYLGPQLPPPVTPLGLAAPPQPPAPEGGAPGQEGQPPQGNGPAGPAPEGPPQQ